MLLGLLQLVKEPVQSLFNLRLTENLLAGAALAAAVFPSSLSLLVFFLDLIFFDLFFLFLLLFSMLTRLFLRENSQNPSQIAESQGW